MGGLAGSGDHRCNPESSETRVSQGRPGGARSHHPLTEGFSPSEFQDLRDRLEIFFRNLLWWASLKEHAIVCGPEQQLGCAGRFRITPWSVVLLSAQIVAEGGLGHEYGAPTHLPELR